MSEVLYRKYRSQKFSELVGQNSVSRTLANAVKLKKISHAYIFSGPRGTGKTSTARILAKAANCSSIKDDGEPCGECTSCLEVQSGRSVDVVEIDAASHTGVDDIRSIIERVEFSPVHLKRKVYIIDEVHMLSKSAFNALLKTLEEPPEHVLFILATTEIHKVPITILSRCQRFDFKLGTIKDIRLNLERIVDAEKLEMEPEALDFVAKLGQGSYRDSITLLSQVVSNADPRVAITVSDVSKILGLPDNELLKNFTHNLIAGHTAACFEIIQKCESKGLDLKQFRGAFLEKMKNLLEDKVNDVETEEYREVTLKKIFEIISAFSLNSHSDSEVVSPSLALELSIIKLSSLSVQDGGIIIEGNKIDQKKVIKKVIDRDKISNQKENNKAKRKVETLVNAYDIKDDLVKIRKQSDLSDNKLKPVCLDDIKHGWVKFLDKIKESNGHLYAFLIKSRLDKIENGFIYITVPFAFYKEQIEGKSTMKVLDQAFISVYELVFRIKCSVGSIDENPNSVCKKDGELEKDVLDVFGKDII